MARAFLLVMDSFGLGNGPDAQKFGDAGSDTLGHIAEQCALGNCDVKNGRSGPLHLPFLDGLGLGLAAHLSTGKVPAGLSATASPAGKWGCAREVSSGKDTISGHWEMAGLPVTFDWGYFTAKTNSFPQSLIDDLVREGNLPGILGNCQASGTAIIAELGGEHIKTGKPICYTSADSVFQIAAHEEHFGLDRLYELCELTRKLVDPLNIGRVIARPFVGEGPETFKRTANRHDYAVPPTGKTLLDRVGENGGEVYAIGKVSDIFTGQGVDHKLVAFGHDALIAATITARDQAKSGDLVFTNFVDFDMLYGHPRDVTGYATALEAFDKMLKDFSVRLEDDDLVIITADHGNDPTWRGTDHTREQVPVIMFGPKIVAGGIGSRETFADIGATISEHLGLKPAKAGTSFY